MKNIVRNILVCAMVLSLSCGNVLAVAMPEPVAQTTAQDKQKAAKQKAAEKKKKEQEKAKAQKQKEQAKKKAAAQKANDKKQAERQKAQAERQKEADKQAAQRAKEQLARQKEAERLQAAKEEAAAEKQAQEEAQKQAWLKQQAGLADPTPKTEVVSLFNIGAKVGYAAMMDKMSSNLSNVSRPGQLDSKYAYQSLTGGAGAGLSATYELEYGAFRFETGLDFTWLNSRSDYGFALTRGNNYYPSEGATPIHQTYTYTTDDLREVRNVGYIGLPVMFGAQFDRYFFMVGAKVGYGLFGNYSQRGSYDITVLDDEILEPYGMGIVNVPQTAADNRKLNMRQPSVSICAEFGIDLDEWMQAQPDKKNKKRVKAGERLPFGREHIHYKVSAFAEYGVLNTNNPTGAMPLIFNENDYRPQATNSMLALSGTKLNNLFVGLKFAVQFEVPGKTARPVPPPASYTTIRVVDAATGETLNGVAVEIINTKNNRPAMKQKVLAEGTARQRTNVGNYVAIAQAKHYYPEDVTYSIIEPGTTTAMEIRLRRMPLFRVSVSDAESGVAIPAQVEICPRKSRQAAYTLATDSTSGASSVYLADTATYTLRIAQVGYEEYEAPIAHIGDSMHVVLKPIKKGEVFVMRNLHFATNKTRILSSSEEALEALFGYLERNPEIRIKIMGHTDNVGKDAANQRLSEGRAEAVREDLIKRGINETRIEAEGYGETRPIDTNDTEEGRQNNRRVEVEVL